MAKTGEAKRVRRWTRELLHRSLGVVLTTTPLLVPLTSAGVFATLASHPAESHAEERGLQAGDFRVRVSAALALGRSKAPSARLDLERALSDSHPAVRTAAAAALLALGDSNAAPALKRAVGRETSPGAQAQMQTSLDGLQLPPGCKGVEWDKARYVVQLGAMRNSTGVRGDQLTQVLRSATKARAQSVPGAVVVEADEMALVKQARARKVPVVAIDGSLIKLDQATAGGKVSLSARVEFTVRKEQSLKGTLAGGALAEGTPRALTPQVIAELQDKAVNGAVASALAGAEQPLAKAAAP